MDLTPTGMTEPDALPEAALSLLRSRLNIDFTVPYRDAGDRRHELASLAVHLGRRVLDLMEALKGAADRDMVVLRQLSEQASAHEDFHADGPQAWPWQEAVLVTHSRLSEVERTLRVVAMAYKQAWWSLEPVREVGTAGT